MGDCATVEEATACKFNRENIRRYMLEHRPEQEPRCVFSTRYQGTEGKGDTFHRLHVSEASRVDDLRDNPYQDDKPGDHRDPGND